VKEQSINSLKTDATKAVERAYELGYAEGRATALQELQVRLETGYGFTVKPEARKRTGKRRAKSK
jgi:hypothetical protein